MLGRPSKQRPPELFIISIDSLERPVNDLRVPLCTALPGHSNFRVILADAVNDIGINSELQVDFGTHF